LAADHGIQAIAFPAIGIGALGFPLEIATRMAFDVTSQFLRNNRSIGTIRFVCFDEASYQQYRREFKRASA
ncbi:MAG: macro domain-containing protein, partial [Leptolyngbyaceae cyanobacterium]